MRLVGREVHEDLVEQLQTTQKTTEEIEEDEIELFCPMLIRT
jgi:hypothetical protein